MDYQEFKKVYLGEKSRDTISISWVTGGISGGSCWNDGGHFPMDAEPEPEFVEFDDLLTKICPNISFLQYKKLYNTCVKTTSKTEWEYYGNSTTYGIKSIDLKTLYSCLVEMEIL